MAPQERPTKQDGDRIYNQVVKPLEQEHYGEFIAVSPNGQFVLAPSFGEALRTGSEKLGKGNFVFKVGEKVVGSLL